MGAPRIEPLLPEELTTEQREFLAPFTNRRGRFPNIFGTLVRHMDLLTAWSDFGLYTMRGSELDPIHREILILRTAVLIGSEYEWFQHEKIGARLGMTEEDFACIRNAGRFADAGKRLMMDCANELVEGHQLADETWAAMSNAFELPYILDAIFTVGAYTALGMALNSCGVQVEAST